MSIPDFLYQEFKLYGSLNTHRRKVERARQRITQWLRVANHPYIAFSGGKDSTCILSLIREQSNVSAVYFDADCSFLEVDIVLDQTSNLIRYSADEPFLNTLKRIGLFSDDLERTTMQTTVYGPINRLLKDYAFDGVCYGLRADESESRARHARKRGAVFQYKRDSIWGCQPIWDWTYQDVWAFIVSQNLPYCSVYDKLWDAPKEDQRLSYWAGETKRRYGRYVWLKRNYPDLWNRLCASVPEISIYA